MYLNVRKSNIKVLVYVYSKKHRFIAYKKAIIELIIVSFGGKIMVQEKDT